MKEWESHWDRAAPHNKLLVYEFYDKNSTLYKAMDMLLDNLAKQYKGQAEFYKLDVDNFELLAGFAEWRERIRRSCYSRTASRWARSSASRKTNSRRASRKRWLTS